MKTVYDLMVEVACKLAKQPVRLRFKHNKGFKGLCRKDSLNRITIDLEPELQFQNEREFLRVFLHECSHAKTDNLIPYALEVSDSELSSEYIEHTVLETRADSNSYKWLRFAEENRNLNYDYFEGCLLALLNSSF